MKIIMIFFLILILLGEKSFAQNRTYCNPINIDYAYNAIPNFVTWGKHRTTADPVITLFKDKYYLFSTNQYGYWWSEDLSDWNFVPRLFLKPWHKVYDELCAPAVFSLQDTLFVIGSTHTKTFPLWMSTDPTTDSWSEAVDSFQVGAWDPAFFEDDDRRLYIYWGSSNTYPVYGQEINRKTFQPVGEHRELIRLHDDIHGWERFGERADNTFLSPFIEGAWMNKHNGKYYLQYAAPGTEFSGYGDGVYISENPLGPFKYQSHNPFSYKPGGFARGAGHGATFQGKTGKWWHVSTITIAVKNNFERRIGLWPAGFDKDDILYCNTAFGDYPHYFYNASNESDNGLFTGWMLLNYNKPVTVSSTLGGYHANFAVDEDIQTYWSANSSDPGEFLQSDLGGLHTIYAIQINYADQNADLIGKQNDIFHQYKILQSADGENWSILVDKSDNKKDVPHDYIEFEDPVKTRFLKIENIHVPTGTFAISGFRVFGIGSGIEPGRVANFQVLRGESELRNAWIKWQQLDNATGYNIYCGIEPDKLYTCIMVYGKNEYYFAAMDKDKKYYFAIEAFNENGIGPRSEVVEIGY
ncbi:MAG: family 43 glycosylhydrolase [Calditrichaeota bacterium]|nr:family 43 glycosylhydrolase [Calditrichota bacterium]